MRPGAPDNIVNPVKDWEPSTEQSARTNCESGTDVTMSDAEYVLLAKYGTDQWNPSKLTVTGLNGKLLGKDGEQKVFFPGSTLNKDNKKWRWMKVSE